MLTFGFLTASQATASAETRTLKLYYTHTGEKAEITYKRNGRYDAAGLKKLNQFLRDWRRNEPTKMDPRLFDVVWEAYRSAGGRDYIHVVSAYRSPATNSLLRSRSSGVAEKSQHMLGKAMDFFVPGVPLKKLRDAGLRVQAGGVGYYPRSGSPFIHMDVGNVRHWPRMSRRELVAVFPSGKTLHVPSDGKPLPGFEQALASYQSRKKSGDLVLASAAPAKRSGGLFAALFGGGGADEEEDTGEIAVAAVQPKRAPAKAIAEAPAAAKPLPGIQIVAPENAQRAELPQVADEAPDQQAPETIIAALPARSVPLPGMAPRPQAEVGLATAENVPFGAASAPVAEGEPPTAVEQQIAANVPLPTWRPNYNPPAELKPENQSVLMALASTDDVPATASDVTAPLPSARPQDMTVEAALAAADDIPAEDESGQDELEIASLAPQPEPRSVFDQPETVATATPKAAITTASAGTDPAAAVGGNVKTTRKSARPLAQEAKPEPKAVVVAAVPDAARWALRSGEQVTTVTTNTKAPGFAYNMVRTAPKEVYTAGFQQGNQAADAHRFSGSAVKFLSVARFQTN
ncbi:DUF882 domain-containing protein [Aminobacter anthyllidis]|uniref:Murein endopeptidase K n=1 Tax=Aminobacter anthyllidis TaxID=1035067 RepID=A0A9X1AF88_9HYPH|nr:DUF882 domain-containing protein [Aminobacter anthyllidis]MBT1158742.1 DUF882 domain-containing protein [Aminobacter anthyllidis]